MSKDNKQDSLHRLLAIRPAAIGPSHGGDEIMYTKSFAYLRERWAMDVLELSSVGPLAKLLKMATMTPPECTRYMSRANREAVARQLASQAYSAVLLFHEATFPILPVVKQAGVSAVLLPQNVHSLVASTDPSRIGRAMRPLALAFERRFYADPDVRLVAISDVDIAGLHAAGIHRDDVVTVPPGAPPVAPLSFTAPVIGEAVITGSYAWWRKQRDLASFAGTPQLGVPILASDEQARQILGDEASKIPDRPGFWSEGLRFGLVTDHFIGGFKLKSTEYIAKNCVVLSRGDIMPDFVGLPYAEEFVRIIGDKADAASVIAGMRSAEPAQLVSRFLEFKQACIRRFDWQRCLDPLGAITQESIER